jgi:triacylglycerol lipase
MQVSSEYIAYNLHQVSQLSGGLKTAVISHSQGGPDTQWALRFWPSTKSVTSSFIALSPDFAGIELADSELSKICVGDLCQASIWQQSSGSKYYNAMHNDSFGEVVPTTAIWTQFDGVVNPPEDNAQLPGAITYSVQNLCPGRLTTHIQMTIDAAAYAFALDALRNGGRASLSRVQSGSWTSCFKITASNMNVSIVKSLTSLFDALVDGFM